VSKGSVLAMKKLELELAWVLFGHRTTIFWNLRQTAEHVVFASMACS